MKEANRLIYEKSNVYRLHADNLRWTLLGGYAAFFTAAATLLTSGNSQSPTEFITLNITLFITSNAYLLILAVQNWFYNLFAKFVKECEERLSKGVDLRPLEDFAVEEGAHVTPIHPAFFFAELIIALTSFYFLYSTFASPLQAYIAAKLITLSPNFQFVPTLLFITCVIVILVFYLIVLNYYLFYRWNETIYKNLIKRFSNLWQPLYSGKEKKKKAG